MDNSLGLRIIKARSALGWSQADLASHSGVAAAQVSRYEQGRNVPRPEVLAKMAKALQVDFDWLSMGATAADASREPTAKRDKVTLTLSNSEYAQFAELAAEEGVSVEVLLNKLFQELLEGLSADDESTPTLEERVARLEELMLERGSGDEDAPAVRVAKDRQEPGREPDAKKEPHTKRPPLTRREAYFLRRSGKK